ncbi:MAG: sulfotransferase domain-containing protein [Okeania sp. SIO2F4]|uniref:sulfotransferase domain-containing protein n=1 Tax=Okeania sp. SIO2F4 TaxID=2607790 RepID=UPI00142911BD|nr:sulfotransferase domain-containing protein [Okeania sp. SIO2F4]NES04237.1 sulfotransferase domain-containing protein [Okeania sp. SIO2F4]
MLHKPNFLLIGAAKAGTTSLTNYLKQHPEIFICPKREPNFFGFVGEYCHSDGEADQGGKERYEFLRKLSIDDIQAYHSQFEKVKDEKAIGEASPLYLYNSRTPQRIYEYRSDIKIIAILRNPVDRAFSHFVYSRARGKETLSNFFDAIKEEEIEVKNIWYGSRHYVRLGFYYSQLEPYFQLFKPSQIRIYLYKDLADNSSKVMQNIFQFLEVDDSFLVNTSVRHNQSLMPKNRVLHNLLTNQSQFKKLMKKFLPEKIINAGKNIRNKNLEKPKVDFPVEARNYLISIYKEDILKLQSLINCDLSHWLENR